MPPDNQQVMKYFTKYIPVEGEAKIGDMVKLVNDPADAHIADADCIHVGCDKVKLFLCSKDIKIGDRMTLEDEDGVMGSSIVTTEPSELIKKAALKGLAYTIMGEISSEALRYVKEGMEYEENDTFPYHIHDENGKIVYLDKYDEPVDTPIYCIKGPCGHYH